MSISVEESNVKSLSQKERVKLAVELFDQMQKVFPNNYLLLSLHDVLPDEVPDGFTIEVCREYDASGNERLNGGFRVAKRLDKGLFDITIFITEINY